MTILDEDGFTQTPVAHRVDRLYFTPAKTIVTLIACCAVVFRLIAAASGFLGIVALSADHGKLGPEMGWWPTVRC